MTIQVLGLSHHTAPLAIRERLAVGNTQLGCALGALRARYPQIEFVLLSTCNRVELYAAAEHEDLPLDQILSHFTGGRGVDRAAVTPFLSHRGEREAIVHLFSVAASLDSMVVGEPQILAQVKQAYEAATLQNCTGPLLHAAFQGALKAARRVATETTLHQRRVSIPSVAVADFARSIFERFDDKCTLVIGAGEMAEETLRYLRDEGVCNVQVVNRSDCRAADLAERWNGRALPWSRLREALAEADLVISTTGAGEPIVTAAEFAGIEAVRYERPLFILDLAVPRDFSPTIGERPGVYLYSIDDLRATCEKNLALRDRELPAAKRIIEAEADRFMAEMHHRATGPLIRQLREEWHRPKEEELARLFHRLPHLDDRSREEIRQSFDRLLNKLLHPPLESLRDHARHGIPHSLLEALAKLFRLRD